MRSLRLLILPLAVILFTGCSGILDRGEGEILALLPYPQQVEMTGGFFTAGAGNLTCRITGIDRADEPVLFAQLEELSLKVDNAPAGAENVPDLWLGIPASRSSFQSHCQAAGILLPDTLDQEGYLLNIAGRE